MKKVFLVDDEKSVLNWLQESIKWEDYDCVVAGCSDRSTSALQRMRKEVFDILITDISMPELNGLELIKKVKQFQPNIRIIIISAYSDFAYTREAILLGAEDYLLKPLNKLEIEEALKRISFSIAYMGSVVSSTESNDFKIFQSNMLQRWIKGSDSMDDSNEQMTIAGIDISKKHYSVFIVHIRNLDKEKMLQAFHLCDTYISPLSEGVYFDSLTDIVGVLSGNQEANRNILIQLYEQLRKQFSATIYIILGEMVSHFLQVKNSYESAKFFRLAGMFTKEEVFISKKELSPKLLLKDPAFRDLQLQLEDKNINKSFESALKISTATLNQENKQKMLENRLVIALFFLKTYESILTSDEVENVILLMNSFYKDETPQWLSSYMNLFRKYHNKQINALHPYVLRIINLVEDNYEDPDLNLSTLAEKLKVTSVYLGQLFYLQTEQHFNDYLTDIRLKKVCHLLITTSIKIGNIAKQVGFSSQSYLNRVFRKKYHLTPLEYRQLPH